MHTDQDDGMAEQEIRGPLVFQCKGCRTIVGDSFSFVSAIEDFDIVVLTGKRRSIAFRMNLITDSHDDRFGWFVLFYQG